MTIETSYILDITTEEKVRTITTEFGRKKKLTSQNSPQIVKTIRKIFG